MAHAILPPIRTAPRCTDCEIAMVETHTQYDRLYTCRKCGHTRHADAYDRAAEAQALAGAEGMSFDEAWELVETLADYAALWDARAVIARWQRNAA